MAILAADTDKIKSDKLREAQRIAQDVKDGYDTSIQINMPPGVVRSKNDRDVMKFLQDQIEVVTQLLDAVVRLSGSDIPPTDDIRKLFEYVEDLNSSNGSRKGH